MFLVSQINFLFLVESIATKLETQEYLTFFCPGERLIIILNITAFTNSLQHWR